MSWPGVLTRPRGRVAMAWRVDTGPRPCYHALRVFWKKPFHFSPLLEKSPAQSARAQLGKAGRRPLLSVARPRVVCSIWSANLTRCAPRRLATRTMRATQPQARAGSRPCVHCLHYAAAIEICTPPPPPTAPCVTAYTHCSWHDPACLRSRLTALMLDSRRYDRCAAGAGRSAER